MTLRLETLGPRHAAAILAGQDKALAAEVVGERWEPGVLEDFLQRTARWRQDGPIREVAAILGAGRHSASAAPEAAQLVGGGGLNLMAPGLGRGEAAMTYWLLAEHRGQGWGIALGRALVDLARPDARIGRLVLRIAPHNGASQEIARRVGAVRTGQHERHPADASRSVERWVRDLR